VIFLEQTIEAMNDVMVARESEMLYKSKGMDVPEPAKSIDEAKANLREAESKMYLSED
jgi:hypothetical protein